MVEGGLVEVRNDGQEVGEIVMRGNLVMKVSCMRLVRPESDLTLFL